MALISFIAAIDENWGLGKNNQLLCHLSADLKHFKKLTLGKPVIMGRKTYESIGKPLPGRRNLVLSRQAIKIAGVEVYSSLEDAILTAKLETEVMIIGGSELFKQALPLASKIYLTKIHHRFEADVFFPQFDEANWQLREMGSQQADDKNAYAMTFYCYQHKILVNG